ncbi:MAG: Dihydrolipoyl dehydrogenase [Methanocella sp. PtaU1.Bin125]|nr:MAG: Dihydrolipoyl dehydrogenase [Methanocella sp. PtaU1.Bin125]
MVVGEIDIGTDVLVIGSGPAGYTAAIRCGQLGLDATLAGTQLGGVCLNLGCIPYKALMHSLDLALAARESEMFGVTEQAALDLQRANEWKDRVIGRLRDGVSGLLKASSVQVLDGLCSFTSSSTALVKNGHGGQHIEFKRAVIATGSHYRAPKGVRMGGGRIINPYSLARLDRVPGRAVVIGGGFGGMTSVALLARMGTEVIFAFKGKTPVAIVDDDLLQPAQKWLEAHGVRLMPEATWDVAPDGATVKITSGGKDYEIKPDQVVYSTPQEANTGQLNLQATAVKVDSKGFIIVDGDFRTADPSIYAIGDVLGGARNAATAYREGTSVAQILAGKPGLPDYQAMPFTLYTVPPIASAGLSEKQAKAQGIDVLVGTAPYTANGAAALSGETTGMAKVIADRASHRILGVQIAGKNATDIIAEGMLAVETGARLEDVALTIHPHPELCEVFYEACARAAGLSTNRRP